LVFITKTEKCLKMGAGASGANKILFLDICLKHELDSLLQLWSSEESKVEDIKEILMGSHQQTDDLRM
jgi:hypothetical protein